VTTSIFCVVSQILQGSKIADFNIPYLHLAPRNVNEIFVIRNLDSLGYHTAWAVLLELRSVNIATDVRRRRSFRRAGRGAGSATAEPVVLQARPRSAIVDVPGQTRSRQHRLQHPMVRQRRPWSRWAVREVGRCSAFLPRLFSDIFAFGVNFLSVRLCGILFDQAVPASSR